MEEVGANPLYSIALPKFQIFYLKHIFIYKFITENIKNNILAIYL